MNLEPFARMTRGTSCMLVAGEEALCTGHDLTPKEDRALAEGKSIDVSRRKLSEEEYGSRLQNWLAQGAAGVHIFNDPHRFDVFRSLSRSR